MPILIAGLVAAVILLLLPRFLGRRQERVLKQYEVLEKRFGFTRRVSQSRWGKGIGEHYSLHGESRGYPLSLYSHFLKKDKRRTDWTSLVFEVLFVEELEFCIEFSGMQKAAAFSPGRDYPSVEKREKVTLSATEDLSRVWNDESVAKRLQVMGSQASVGAVRLSKGFLEYRELGFLEGEAERLRFQEAILLLASLSDALSLFMSERRAAGSRE